MPIAIISPPYGIIRLEFGREALFQSRLLLSDELAGVLGIVLGDPVAEEKCALTGDHGVELFAFVFAEAVFVVFAVNAFVVLPDD